MPRLATRADFHAGDNAIALYTDYRRFPFFSQRAEWIREHYSQARMVLVVGCAYGYLVDELRQRGVDAWGIEASEYAVWRARREIGANARYVVLGDATVPKDLAECCMRATASPFDLAVTEDVLTVCSDDEALLMLGSVRIVAAQVLHIVTPGHPDEPQRLDKTLNWKSIEEWTAFCDPNPVLDAESWEVHP